MNTKAIVRSCFLDDNIEFHAYWEFFCGLFPYRETPEWRNKLKELFKLKDIRLEDRPHYEESKYPWIFLHLDEFNKYSKVAYHIYDDSHNKLFVKSMDDIVHTFYEQITKVYTAWKKICEELNYQLM